MCLYDISLQAKTVQIFFKNHHANAKRKQQNPKEADETITQNNEQRIKIEKNPSPAKVTTVTHIFILKLALNIPSIYVIKR